MNKLTLGICTALMLVLLAVSVNATVLIEYNTQYAEITNTGSVIGTTTAVNGFSVAGFACATDGCTQRGNQIPGLTGSSNTDKIVLEFPTNMNQHGYVLYFYKDGYIGWEQRNIKIGGNSNGQVISSPNPMYLSRKRQAYAPIKDMSVVNSIATYMPIQIDVDVDIDARTFAALRDISVSGIASDYEPAIETEVVLTIYNTNTNQVVKQETKNLDITVSGSQRVYFDHVFTDVGTYNVDITTNVPDARVISSIPQTSLAQVEVLPSDIVDYTYTLIQKLDANREFPEVNDNVEFSFEWVTNYVDPNEALVPIQGVFDIVIYTDAETVFTDTRALGPANNPTIYNQELFGFTFTEPGIYYINVTGNPLAAIGGQAFGSSQQIMIIVKEETVIDMEPPVVTILSPESTTYQTSVGLAITYTVVDDVAVDTCWAVLNNGPMEILPNCENTSFTSEIGEGTHTLQIFANDTSGNVGVDEVTFFIEFPQCLADSDCGDAFVSDSFCDGSELVTETTTPTCIGGVCENIITITRAPDQSCETLICEADSDCGEAFISDSFCSGSNLVTETTTPTCTANGCQNITTTTSVFNANCDAEVNSPVITIQSPVENQLYERNTYIDLMYTVTGSNIDTCWYTINNGPAILLENCENTEFRITEPGDYTIRVYANNSAGNIGMSSRTFTIVWQIHTREDIYRPVVVQEREHIHIESFTLDRDDYSLQSNRETEVFLRFRNTGNFEIRNIQATVSIPELGVWDRATVHRLRVGQAETLNLYLGLPHVEPGFYYVRLTLAGQGDRLGMNGYSRGIWYEVYIQ